MLVTVGELDADALTVDTQLGDSEGVCIKQVLIPRALLTPDRLRLVSGSQRALLALLCCRHLSGMSPKSPLDLAIGTKCRYRVQ